MELGLVGCGSIAVEHMRALDGIQSHSVAWVVGREPTSTEAFAGEWGIRRWSCRLDEALGWPASGVIITSPSDLHADQALCCLEAGRHVLVEIPLATNLADCRRVQAAAAARALRVQVAQTQRYHPALLELHRRIESGVIRPHHLVCRWFFLRRENINWMGRRRSWTDNLLWHHACHVVDAALWLLGGPASGVQAQFGPLHPVLGIPLDLDLQFRVGSVPVSIAMSYNSLRAEQEYTLIGEEDTLAFTRGGLLDATGRLWEPSSDAEEAIPAQNREWLDAIREGREPEVAPAAVLAAMEVLHQAQLNLDAIQ